MLLYFFKNVFQNIFDIPKVHENNTFLFSHNIDNQMIIKTIL